MMGFLHIGQNVMVNDRRIIGIFDLDITSQSAQTRRFLDQAEQEGVVLDVSGELPKSFVVCDHPYHPDSAEKSGKEVNFFPVIAGRSADTGFPGMTGQTQGKERSSNERTGKSHRCGHHL